MIGSERTSIAPSGVKNLHGATKLLVVISAFFEKPRTHIIPTPMVLGCPSYPEKMSVMSIDGISWLLRAIQLPLVSWLAGWLAAWLWGWGGGWVGGLL